MKNPAADWMKLTHDSYWLWAESMMVIGMRTAEMMSGRGSAKENALMVSEKVGAALELGLQMSTASPQKAVSHYRRKVSANRRRLARKSS